MHQNSSHIERDIIAAAGFAGGSNSGRSDLDSEHVEVEGVGIVITL